MPLLSIVINCDTRNENNTFGGENLKGCVSEDFLTDGVWNKVKFFDEFDKEVIVCIDEHNPVKGETLKYIRSISDCVLIRKHTLEPKFNDYNYLRGLSLASGDIIIKIDQDTNCFTSSKDYVQELINLLDTHTVVSYPSMFSPNPDVNSNYDYWWASTRFVMFKKDFLDLTEIKKCLQDSDFLYTKYPASVFNPWLEHICGLQAKYNGNGTYYPPIEENKGLIFSWSGYEKYTLRRLNELSYNEVKDWVGSRKINYPNDVYGA